MTDDATAKALAAALRNTGGQLNGSYDSIAAAILAAEPRLTLAAERDAEFGRLTDEMSEKAKRMAEQGVDLRTIAATIQRDVFKAISDD